MAKLKAHASHTKEPAGAKSVRPGVMVGMRDKPGPKFARRSKVFRDVWKDQEWWKLTRVETDERNATVYRCRYV